MLVIVIFVFLLVGIDLYTYRGISNIFINIDVPVETFRAIHWSVAGLAILMILAVMMLRKSYTSPNVFPKLYYFTGFIAVIYLPKLIFATFLLVEDVLSVFKYLAHLSTGTGSGFSAFMNSVFNNYWISVLGLSVSIVAMLSIMHSILWGRFNFKAKEIEICSNKIPEEFDGFRVLQFSDMHIGSFWGHEGKVRKAAEFMKKQNADLIVFTGDMVNHRAEELVPFISEFRAASAEFGKYAILGNHDYGLYVDWASEEEKQLNLKKLKEFENEAGFRLLLNENVRLSKGRASIQLVGVENWGKPPFPQFGDVKMALEGADSSLFTILLSHDPSHWDAQIAGQTHVDLTLSGHTHGMQLGFNLDSFKWSPVQLKYPKWNGLYHYQNQKLYVNIGLGFIAFPMRVGMHPEMSVFVLRSK